MKKITVLMQKKKRKDANMKKRSKAIALFLLITVLAGALSSGAYACFGSGVDVIAQRCEIIKTGISGSKIVFSDLDVKQALCITDFESITVKTIPESSVGTLMLAGRRVRAGQEIKRKNIGALVFIPASREVSECRFEISVKDYLDGSSIDVVLRFSEKVNYTPTATLTDGILKTQRNIRIYGTLTSEDREGDEVEYVIIKYPERGSLYIEDRKTGNFVYTPPADYVGDDTFTYVVRDSYGNFSRPVDVPINIRERMSEVVYRDMTDHPDYSAAVALTAMGAVDGRLIGDGVYFCPDESVSRAEFVAMAMKCAGIGKDDRCEVYFDDRDEISPPLLPYVSRAATHGIASGAFANGELLFRPNSAITRYEAAQIIASLLGTEDYSELPVFSDTSDCPVYAEGALLAMYSLGIYDDENNGGSKEPLTKAECVSALYRMTELLG